MNIALRNAIPYIKQRRSKDPTQWDNSRNIRHIGYQIKTYI